MTGIADESSITLELDAAAALAAQTPKSVAEGPDDPSLIDDGKFSIGVPLMQLMKNEFHPRGR